MLRHGASGKQVRVMPQYGTWFTYAGAARIWLAAGLLVGAAALVGAGIRLPLPIGGARAGRAAMRGAYLAWVAAMVLFVVCFVIYVRQYVHAYHISLGMAQPRQHVAPFTFLAVVTVFITIATLKPAGTGTRLATAAVGAVAGLSFFEFPFQLIIMTRMYPPIPPDPLLYRVLLNAPLFAVEITTLLLLRLSPMVRLTRATFFCLALMLAVFAAWAGTGFGYPLTPLPITLNIVAKLLSFAVVLTLFLPQQQAAPAPSVTVA
jgi:hypothetical protein